MSAVLKEVFIDSLVVKDQLHRTKGDVSDLIESLQKGLQIHPIIVKKENGAYRVIAGRRRFAAFKAIQVITGKKVKVNIHIVDTDNLREELIKIDENIIRKELQADEYDEQMLRRKEIYEEMHPETRQHAIAAATRDKKTSRVSFTKDTSAKLNVNKKTVERAVARASKAVAEVKLARKQGLIPSKVDLIIKLDEQDQKTILPFVKDATFAEAKKIVERAQKIGAKATVLYLKEEQGEDDPRELKRIMTDCDGFLDQITKALGKRMTFKSNEKFENMKRLDALAEKISKFTSFQRAAAGSRVAIRRRNGEEKIIRQSHR